MERLPEAVVIGSIPVELREQYLAQLPEPQELHMEELVGAGTIYGLGDVGYAVVNEGTLVEFYVASSHQKNARKMFDALLTRLGVARVVVKSFDAQLIALVLSRPTTTEVSGLLFRDIADPEFKARADLNIRLAAPQDTAVVASINDNFFTSIDEIAAYIENAAMFVLEQNSEIVGCGIGTG